MVDVTTNNEALRAQARAIAITAAEVYPESYYAEPFEPHEWVIQAVILALASQPQGEPARSGEDVR